MRYASPLVEGVILDRRKRFLADVCLPSGETVVAHLANTGKMTGCWTPGGRCRLSLSTNAKRKLPWSVEQTHVEDRWILVNTARPNRLVEEALVAGRIQGLSGSIKREVPWPEGGRADFLIDGSTWVEVKSATLLAQQVVWFPDTVTTRGTRHLDALTARVRAGERAVLIVCAGTEGALEFRPATHLDPAWCAALDIALKAGVELRVHSTRLSAQEATLAGPLPFTIPGREAVP